ncbi:MAG: sugar phosphate isomerase/epimerase [Chitinophagaceae bacterium]|nr:MAG: sugar phosphate isomerase/epimerase [Chitinophagaceae bacterium]
MNQYNRRAFIKLGGGFAAAMALAPMACKSGSKLGSKRALDNFGLQLYTLRDDLPKDPKGVLKQVASFGYKQVEGYEGPQGMFWGMGNTGFKQYMDDLGMTFVSSHCDIYKNFEQKAADAAAIGMKYLICPYKGPQKTLDDYKKFADDLNQKGQVCKQNGIRFAYHNHDYTFKPLDGQMPQDILMANTDKDSVDYEMDIYWVVAAGQDPEAWFNKYKNRFRLCHVKDRTRGAVEAADSTTLGQGSIDYSKILTTAKANGMDYYIVEQEKYTGTTPLKAVEDDAAYMKKLVF